MCFENMCGMYVTVVYKERSLLEVTWLADVSRRLETFPAWIRTRCDSCDLLIIAVTRRVSFEDFHAYL